MATLYTVMVRSKSKRKETHRRKNSFLTPFIIFISFYFIKKCYIEFNSNYQCEIQK